jgi:hypothetical protein
LREEWGEERMSWYTIEYNNLDEIYGISTYFDQDKQSFPNTNPGHCWNIQGPKQVIINIKNGFMFTHTKAIHKKVNIRKFCDAYF